MGDLPPVVLRSPIMRAVILVRTMLLYFEVVDLCIYRLSEIVKLKKVFLSFFNNYEKMKKK